jgi:hypothetical protein
MGAFIVLAGSDEVLEPVHHVEAALIVDCSAHGVITTSCVFDPAAKGDPVICVRAPVVESTV